MSTQAGDPLMLRHGRITEQMVQAFYRVYSVLGPGFLEKVYENALVLELRKRGLTVRQQAPIKVYYEGEQVGDYYADLLVENCVIAELKAAGALADEHHAQLLNYLRATGIEFGLLLNFGPRPEVKRKILDAPAKVQLQGPREPVGPSESF